MRILFWIAVIILIGMVVRAKLRGSRSGSDSGSGSGAGPLGRKPKDLLDDGEAMACCAHCHIYFPASEAVRADGQDYCSPAHVRVPAR